MARHQLSDRRRTYGAAVNLIPFRRAKLTRIEHVGAYYIIKTLDRLVETQDYYTVAKQLRKQGVPLDIARVILFGRN